MDCMFICYICLVIYFKIYVNCSVNQILTLGLPESNGYIYVEANGGLNQQRASICNAVVVAGCLNATLVISNFHYHIWRDPRKFQPKDRMFSLSSITSPAVSETCPLSTQPLVYAENRELIARMKSILGPFILRRLKSDVTQQLVPKIQKVEYVFMQKEQDDAYKEDIKEYRAFCLSRLSKTSDIDYAAMIKALPLRKISNYFHQFRKIANHPLLIRRILFEMKGCNDFCIHQSVRKSLQLPR